MDFNENLLNLRDELSKLNIDAILVSLNNSFGNFQNNVSDIMRISGFSGSNGKAIISKNEAVLSVDGRYIKQATDQIDNRFWKVGMYPEINTTKMILNLTKEEQTLGIGPFSISYNTYLSIIKLSNKIGFKIKILDKFPILCEKISDTKLFLMNENETGENRKNRIERVKETLKIGESIIVFNKSLIGWIFGLRLSRPTEEKCVLPNAVAFIQKNKKPIVFSDLNLSEDQNDFVFAQFDKFEDMISNSDKSIVCMDFSNIPTCFPMTLQKYGFQIKQTEKNYSDFESIKNKTEIINQKNASELTSIAFIKTLSYIENSKKTSEIEAVNFFENTLRKNESFFDLSFNAISAFGKNTYIVHYNPKIYGDSEISGDGLFLFDAGAHFKNSTTDITRVIYRGENPNHELKRIYSIILKSVITFSTAKFPDKTKSSSLDSIARFNIWKYGFDYNFGTGHGVGSFANVHEYPRISQNSSESITKDMIFTVEPGIYNNDFGIRLENMLLTKQSEKQGFIEFETLSFIPFCKKLIIAEFFDDFEINWINNYHKNIFDKFSNIFENDKITLNWLYENTKEIK